MQIVYLIFTLICSAGVVFIYRLGVEDGKERCDTSSTASGPPSPPRRRLKRNTREGDKNVRDTAKKQSKELSPEDKKIKEGIANILSYGIGGDS